MEKERSGIDKWHKRIGAVFALAVCPLAFLVTSGHFEEEMAKFLALGLFLLLSVWYTGITVLMKYYYPPIHLRRTPPIQLTKEVETSSRLETLDAVFKTTVGRRWKQAWIFLAVVCTLLGASMLATFVLSSPRLERADVIRLVGLKAIFLIAVCSLPKLWTLSLWSYRRWLGCLISSITLSAGAAIGALFVFVPEHALVVPVGFLWSLVSGALPDEV